MSTYLVGGQEPGVSQSSRRVRRALATAILGVLLAACSGSPQQTPAGASPGTAMATRGPAPGASAVPSSSWYPADTAAGFGPGSPCALLPSPAVAAVFGPLTSSELVQGDGMAGDVGYSTGTDTNGDPYCNVNFMPADRPAADTGNDPPVVAIGMSQTSDINAFLSQNGWDLGPAAGAAGELGGHSVPLTGLEAIVPVPGGFVYANDAGPQCTLSACPDGVTLAGLERAAAVEARQIVHYPVSGGVKGVSSIP